MPSKPPLPPSERIAQSFKDLATSSAQLNAASDEFSRAITPIDAALKKLNVGLTVWHKYVGNRDQNGDYWGRRIGYAKISGKWGLALSTVAGNMMDDDESAEEWLFNDAPRWIRLEAIDHVPALLDSLVEHVTEAATELKKKTAHARELSAMITAVAGHVAPEEA